MSQPFLTVGRMIGLENYSQLKGLVKGLASGKNGTYSAHLKLDVEATKDMLIKIAVEEGTPATAFQMGHIVGLAYKHFPRSMAQGVETFIDVIVSKFGPKSGKLELKSVQKDAKGVIDEAVVKLLGNSSGGKVSVKAAGEAGTAANMDAYISRTNSDKADLVKLAKSINYAETPDGITKLAVDAKNAGVIKTLNVEVTSPTAYLDEITKVQTGLTVKESIEMLKSMAVK